MNEELVKEVKIALIRRGWNQGDLARKVGISQAYLSLVMQGGRDVPWIWERIEEELGISFSAVRA